MLHVFKEGMIQKVVVLRLKSKKGTTAARINAAYRTMSAPRLVKHISITSLTKKRKYTLFIKQGLYYE